MNILLVDDTPLWGVLIRRALPGHHVTVIERLQDAEPTEFDLVLIDWLFPDAGEEDVRDLIARCQTPCAIVTAEVRFVPPDVGIPVLNKRDFASLTEWVEKQSLDA